MKNSELGIQDYKVGSEEIKEQLKLKGLPYSANVRARVILLKSDLITCFQELWL